MLTNQRFQLILASSSKRRKEILQLINVPFAIHPSNVDEDSITECPKTRSIELAERKGHYTLNHLEKNLVIKNPLVIASDTIVYLDGTFFEKPKSRNEAKTFLKTFSGCSHEVHTGVFIGTIKKTQSFSVKTKVFFSEIDDLTLEEYLDSKDYCDKAGGYGIQGMASIFIEKIEGCYLNVVGMPLNRLISELKSFLGDQNWKGYL